MRISIFAVIVLVMGLVATTATQGQMDPFQYERSLVGKLAQVRDKIQNTMGELATSEARLVQANAIKQAGVTLDIDDLLRDRHDSLTAQLKELDEEEAALLTQFHSKVMELRASRRAVISKLADMKQLVDGLPDSERRLEEFEKQLRQFFNVEQSLREQLLTSVEQYSGFYPSLDFEQVRSLESKRRELFRAKRVTNAIAERLVHSQTVPASTRSAEEQKKRFVFLEHELHTRAETAKALREELRRLAQDEPSAEIELESKRHELAQTESVCDTIMDGLLDIAASTVPRSEESLKERIEYFTDILESRKSQVDSLRDDIRRHTKQLH